MGPELVSIIPRDELLSPRAWAEHQPYKDRPLFTHFPDLFLILSTGWSRGKSKAAGRKWMWKISLFHQWERPGLQKGQGARFSCLHLNFVPRQHWKCWNNRSRQEVCLAWSIIAWSGRLGKSCGNLCLCLDELCVVNWFWKWEIYSHGNPVHVRAGSEVSSPPRTLPFHPDRHCPSWPPKSLLVDAASHMYLQQWEKSSCSFFRCCYCSELRTSLFSSAPLSL